MRSGIVEKLTWLMPDAMYWNWRGKRYVRELAAMPDSLKEDFRRQENDIIKVVANLDVQWAMEFGCGFGRVAVALADAIPEIRVAGIDPSRAMIEEARCRQTRRNAFFVGPTTMLHYLVGVYDLTYSVEVLMHMRDPWPAMRAMVLSSKRWILHCELDCASAAGRRNYAHDYIGIYREHGITARFFGEAPFGQALTLVERPQ